MKTFYLFVSLLCVGIHFSNAQCPTEPLDIQSQADIDNFLLAYPNCTELDKIYIFNTTISNLQGFANIEVVTGPLTIRDVSGLTALDGLEGLTAIGGDLYIENNPQLTDISALGGLSELGGGLSVNDNPLLSSISAFQGLSAAGWIALGGNSLLNSLDGLETITDMPGRLFIADCGVSSLVQLSNLTEVQGVKLVNLQSLTTLYGLHQLETIGSYGIHLENMGALANLDALNVTTIGADVRILNCDQLTSIAGISGAVATPGFFGLVQILDNAALTSLDGLEGLTALDELFIEYNLPLSSIEGLKNSLVSDYIVVEHNPNLTSCAIYTICEKIEDGLVSVASNGSNCYNAQAVINDCQSTSSTVSGYTYVDLDCDGEQGFDEPLLPSRMIFRNPGALPFAFGDPEANYSGPITANVSWGLFPQELMGFSPLPAYQIVNTNDQPSSYENKNFGYCPDSFFINYTVDLTASTPPRPGFMHFYEICVENIGSLASPFTLVFSFSNLPGSEFINILDPAGGMIVGDSIVWQINALGVFDQQCFTVTVQMDPATPVGTLIEPYVILSLPAGSFDVDPSDNWDRIYQTVVGSFDPNDKTYYPENYGMVNYLNGEALEYQIRFQNTGNYPATFIEVLDTIEANLDLSTFRMITASHAYTLTFPAERVLKWRFEDINLPDSTSNELESHGFIK
ncbi:MAG: hypothetical protein KDC44_04340, partial [Phaeodactylibacter sp.]|nr:hypothetical protein [Phaeodactylibacter sp.]